MLTQTLARRAAPPLPGWGLWAAWVIATVYGATASLVILLGIPVPLPSGGPIGAIHWAIITALLTSLAQWPVLHRYLPRLTPRQWLGASVLGAVIGFFAGWAVNAAVDLSLLATVMPDWNTHTIRDPVTLAAGGAAAGAILARLQWLALRPYLHGAGRWIYAGAAAWAWAGAAAPIMQNSLWPPPIPVMGVYLKRDPTLVEALSRATGLEQALVFGLMVGLVSGLLIGAITGLALAALVRARWTETA